LVVGDWEREFGQQQSRTETWDRLKTKPNGVVGGGGGPKTIFLFFFSTTKAEHKREKGNKYKREKREKKPGPWVGFYTFLKK
jgi:hypothetical protein